MFMDHFSYDNIVFFFRFFNSYNIVKVISMLLKYFRNNFREFCIMKKSIVEHNTMKMSDEIHVKINLRCCRLFNVPLYTYSE